MKEERRGSRKEMMVRSQPVAIEKIMAAEQVPKELCHDREEEREWRSTCTANKALAKHHIPTTTTSLALECRS
jgi:hypothetical protein